MISIIAAIGAKNRVIGNKGQIPWHLPADLAHFKGITLGHTVIMGRITFESIGKALPGRENIVITSGKIESQSVLIARSIDEALAKAGRKEIYIIGGANIYAGTINIAKRLYITFVDGEFEGDSFFPEIDENVWRRVSQEIHEKDGENEYNMNFAVFEK